MLLGTLKAFEMVLYPCPDQCLATILQSSLDIMAWFLSWSVVWIVRPYTGVCLSKACQFNLPQDDSNQVIDTSVRGNLEIWTKNGLRPGRRLSEQSVLLTWLEGNIKYPITLRKAKTSVPPYLPLSTGLTDPDSPQSDLHLNLTPFYII